MTLLGGGSRGETFCRHFAEEAIEIQFTFPACPPFHPCNSRVADVLWVQSKINLFSFKVDTACVERLPALSAAFVAVFIVVYCVPNSRTGHSTRKTIGSFGKYLKSDFIFFFFFKRFDMPNASIHFLHGLSSSRSREDEIPAIQIKVTCIVLCVEFNQPIHCRSWQGRKPDHPCSI